MMNDDPFDRLLKPVTITPLNDGDFMGTDEPAGSTAFAFCPLLWQDSGGATIAEEPMLYTESCGDEENAVEELPIGYCSRPGCRDCPHLLSRLEEFDSDCLVWSCARCLDDLKPASYPGYYDDGPCSHCGEYSVVLQLVIREP